MQALDDHYYAEVSYELQARVRASLIETARAQGDRFLFATMSALSGRWDDLPRDVARRRITKAQGLGIIAALEKARVISSAIAEYQSSRI